MSWIIVIENSCTRRLRSRQHPSNLPVKVHGDIDCADVITHGHRTVGSEIIRALEVILVKKLIPNMFL